MRRSLVLECDILNSARDISSYAQLLVVAVLLIQEGSRQGYAAPEDAEQEML